MSTAPSCATTPSSPTTAWRRGSTATAPAPRTLAAVRGARRAAAHAGRVAQRAEAVAPRARRADARDARSAAGVRRDGALDGPASRHEEPREGADRGLHDRGQRRDGDVPRASRVSVAAPRAAIRRSAGTRIVELAARLGDALPAAAERGRARRIPADSARSADPARFADLSLAVVKLLGLGRVRRRGARAGTPRGTSASP